MQAVNKFAITSKDYYTQRMSIAEKKKIKFPFQKRKEKNLDKRLLFPFRTRVIKLERFVGQEGF